MVWELHTPYGCVVGSVDGFLLLVLRPLVRVVARRLIDGRILALDHVRVY